MLPTSGKLQRFTSKESGAQAWTSHTAAGRRILSRRTVGRQEPLIDFAVPADGDYLLKVYDFLYGGGPDYVYRLSVHTGPHIDFVLPASGLPNTTPTYTLYGRNLAGGQPSPFKSADGRPLDQLPVQIALPADRVEQPRKDAREQQDADEHPAPATRRRGLRPGEHVCPRRRADQEVVAPRMRRDEER